MCRGSWRRVGVCEGHKIGGDGGLIGLLETGEIERTWDIESRCGIGGWRWLMRMKRSSVISWGSVLVSNIVSLAFSQPTITMAYRDGGNSLCLAAALLTGLYDLMISSVGPAVLNDD